MRKTIRKTFIMIMIASLMMVLWGCDDTTDPPITNDNHPYIGQYLLLQKTVDGMDVSEQYVYNVIELGQDDQATISELDMFGLDVQEGTYVHEENRITVMIGLKAYDFDYDEEVGTLDYDGRIDRRQVVMKYRKTSDFEKPDTGGGVAFTDRLFGESLEENYYNYAPAVVMEGNDTMHVWFCGNGESGNVTDFIVYRKGTLLGDGTWSFSERSLVLSSTEGTWDQRHVCDPTVIKGSFSYNGTDYNYLMGYLGCVTNDSSRNEVGIAVAQSIEGPWVKIDSINPIANYYQSLEYTDDQWTWGYGQPSLVSVDQAGKILLFYTKGLQNGTYQYVEYWDLSNLNDPIKLKEAQITNSGVVNASGGIDVINNADFAYDRHNKRLYVIKEDFPYASGGGVDWLTGANTVMYLNLSDDESHVGETLFAGVALRWQVVRSIGTNETGFARVHNAGIVRDEFGWLIDPTRIPILYTKSDLAEDYPDWELGGQWPALHTYRIHGYLIEP